MELPPAKAGVVPARLVFTTSIAKEIKMAQEKLDPELTRRIGLVEDPAYEGEPLNSKDYTSLVVVGVIIPFLLMVSGWWL